MQRLLSLSRPALFMRAPWLGLFLCLSKSSPRRFLPCIAGPKTFGRRKMTGKKAQDVSRAGAISDLSGLGTKRLGYISILEGALVSLPRSPFPPTAPPPPPPILPLAVLHVFDHHISWRGKMLCNYRRQWWIPPPSYLSSWVYPWRFMRTEKGSSYKAASHLGFG